MRNVLALDLGTGTPIISWISPSGRWPFRMFRGRGSDSSMYVIAMAGRCEEREEKVGLLRLGPVVRHKSQAEVLQGWRSLGSPVNVPTVAPLVGSIVAELTVPSQMGVIYPAHTAVCFGSESGSHEADRGYPGSGQGMGGQTWPCPFMLVSSHNGLYEFSVVARAPPAAPRPHRPSRPGGVEAAAVGVAAAAIACCALSLKRRGCAAWGDLYRRVGLQEEDPGGGQRAPTGDGHRRGEPGAQA